MLSRARRVRAGGGAESRRQVWRRAFRAGLEALESRRLLAGTTFVVNDPGTAFEPDGTSTSGLTATGTITLYSAIEAANAMAAQPVTIHFGFSGPTTISASALLGLDAQVPVTIDTQGQTVVLDGSSARGGFPGLTLDGGDSTVRGLTIQGFSDGIDLEGSGNVIAGCVLQNNLAAGLTGDFTSSTIGGSGADDGNVVVGNNVTGIDLSDGSDNLIQRNLIGVDASGASDPNQVAGLEIDSADDNTVQNNVISNNQGDGIVVYGSGMNQAGGGIFNIIEGNLIGVSPDGSTAMGNMGDGVDVEDAYGTQIGGSGANGNTISANSEIGIEIAANNNNEPLNATVQGNTIGLDSEGLSALGNTDGGIAMDAPDFLITSNLIAGNGGDGIYVGDGAGDPAGDSSKDAITSNRIGMGALENFPNAGDGIDVDQSSLNLIGGATASAGNTIVASSDFGVDVTGGSGNSILTNDIDQNSLGGIFLATGANNNLQAPTLGTNQGAVTGTLTGTPGATYTVQYFAVTSGLDAAAQYEGAQFLRQDLVTIPPGGTASLAPTLNPPAGSVVTATVTDAQGDTSEFSNGVAGTASPPPTGTGTQTASLGLTISPLTPGISQSLGFTATVTGAAGMGTPTGSVTFSVNGTAGPAVTLTSGSATYTPSPPLPAGSYTITATYSGDSTYAPATQTLTTAAPTLTITASAASTSVTGYDLITATVAAPSGVTSTPTGMVTFTLDGAQAQGVTLTNGVAQGLTYGLPAGTHTIGVSYGGDGTFAPAVSTLSLNVAPGVVIVVLSELDSPGPGSAAVDADVTLPSPPSFPPPQNPLYPPPANLGSGTLPDLNGTINFNISGLIEAASSIPVSGALPTTTAEVLTTLFTDGASGTVTASFVPSDMNYIATAPSDSVAVMVSARAQNNNAAPVVAVQVTRISPGSEKGRTIVVSFSAPVNKSSAENPALYTVDDLVPVRKKHRRELVPKRLAVRSILLTSSSEVTIFLKKAVTGVVQVSVSGTIANADGAEDSVNDMNFVLLR